jgi:hypothetical protein
MLLEGDNVWSQRLSAKAFFLGAIWGQVQWKIVNRCEILSSELSPLFVHLQGRLSRPSFTCSETEHLWMVLLQLHCSII